MHVYMYVYTHVHVLENVCVLAQQDTILEAWEFLTSTGSNVDFVGQKPSVTKFCHLTTLGGCLRDRMHRLASKGQLLKFHKPSN